MEMGLWWWITLPFCGLKWRPCTVTKCIQEFSKRGGLLLQNFRMGHNEGSNSANQISRKFGVFDRKLEECTLNISLSF